MKIEKKIVSAAVVTGNPEIKPIVLPDDLPAQRYKITPPGHAAIYILISDYTIAGQKRPVEIFLVSKDQTELKMAPLVTRLTSAALRQPGPFPAYVIDEFLCIRDDGYIIPGSNGRWVPSIAAHIGVVLKNHCVNLGLLEAPNPTTVAMGEQCPSCKEYTLVIKDGCKTCDCGYSKCN